MPRYSREASSFKTFFKMMSLVSEKYSCYVSLPLMFSLETQLSAEFSLCYDGPCPPRDVLHHYHFILYALDQPLNLAAGATKKQVLNAMQGHTLANAKLIGTFEH